MGTRRRYQLFCRGVCAFPAISREPRVVFPHRRKYRKPEEIVHKKYVLSNETFEFGPLLCGKFWLMRFFLSFLIWTNVYSLFRCSVQITHPAGVVEFLVASTNSISCVLLSDFFGISQKSLNGINCPPVVFSRDNLNCSVVSRQRRDLAQTLPSSCNKSNIYYYFLFFVCQLSLLPLAWPPDS